jgi:hypothetical protein
LRLWGSTSWTWSTWMQCSAKQVRNNACKHSVYDHLLATPVVIGQCCFVFIRIY